MITTRPATSEDQTGISSLISYEYYVHRHLDWRSSLEWLGHKPFWLMERGQRVLAALAFPTDPPEVAWVRLFAANASLGPDKVWEELFPPCRDELYASCKLPIACLALHDWFTDVLVKHNFRHFQDIVVLSWREDQPPTRLAGKRDFVLRPMVKADIPAVAQLDQTAFERLWQISANTLEHSFLQSSYSTVIDMDGQIVGYQISTTNNFSAHLARLAVHPDIQRHHLGYTLVQDLQDHFKHLSSRYITVNTQSNNSSSLALYQKLGFHLTGEKFPVYVYDD
jgi:ribosomal protein S18 acetylase RimI-like enzyme